MNDIGKTQAAEPVNPFFAAPINKKRLTQIGVYICVIGSILQSSTLSTLLPVAAGEIGGMDYYSLANTLTGVTSVAIMPLWGYLGAKNPAIKRPLFVVSILIGAAVVFARAFAPNMLLLVIPSTAYGVLSAGIFVLGYSMIRDMFDRKQAGTYLGLCGTMMAVGMLAGPAVGGFLMDNFGWRWVCHIIWPVDVLGAVLVLCGVKVTKEETAHMASVRGAFDYTGAVAMIIFLGALILGLSLGTSFIPFGTPLSFGIFALAIIGLIALFLIMKKKQGAAIISTTAMRDGNTISFMLANFFCMFSNMAVFFFLPMYVITVMQASASEAGIAISLYSVIGMFMGPVFGKAIGKAGTAKGVLSLGCIARIVVAAAFLLVLSPDANIVAIYAIMLFAGIYSSVQSTAFSAGPQVQLPDEIRVQGNSLIQVGQNFGGAIGTAVYTVILAMLGVVNGMTVALVVSLVAALCALICALRLKKLPSSE